MDVCLSQNNYTRLDSGDRQHTPGSAFVKHQLAIISAFSLLAVPTHIFPGTLREQHRLFPLCQDSISCQSIQIYVMSGFHLGPDGDGGDYATLALHWPACEAPVCTLDMTSQGQEARSVPLCPMPYAIWPAIESIFEATQGTDVVFAAALCSL